MLFSSGFLFCPFVYQFPVMYTSMLVPFQKVIRMITLRFSLEDKNSKSIFDLSCAYSFIYMYDSKKNS